MTITFDPAFDSGYWPGPLGDENRGACVGEAWLGALGMLAELELRLGLGGPPVSTAERLSFVLRVVRQLEGFWSESAAKDPISTAEALLRWRDRLWRSGWRGQPVAQRLKELAEVTEGAPPGVVDRLAAV